MYSLGAFYFILIILNRILLWFVVNSKAAYELYILYSMRRINIRSNENRTDFILYQTHYLKKSNKQYNKTMCASTLDCDSTPITCTVNTSHIHRFHTFLFIIVFF